MTLPVTEGLVAAYDFVQGDDPTILYDISGNGHHGTIYGATWTAEGLQFDGTNDYVNLGDLGNLSSEYTIIAAVTSPPLGSPATQCLLSRVSHWSPMSDGLGFSMYRVSAGGCRLMHYDGVGSVYGKEVAQPVQPGPWQVYTAKYTGSQIEMIAAGKIPDKTTKLVGGFAEHSGIYCIGRLSYTGTYYLSGTMGYLAVYNKALTDEEVRQAYAEISETLEARGVGSFPRPIRPTLILSLDDGVGTDYTASYRLASARGIPVTSYINTERINTSYYLTWEQIYEMRDAGFGIECHNHDHSNIDTLTEAELRTNLEAVNAAFVSAGLPPPEHHAYAYGGSGHRDIIAEYRVTGRGGTDERIYYWDQVVGWYGLKTTPIVKHSGDNVDNVKGWIDDAIAGNYVLILFTHDISPSPGPDGCEVALYTEILDYVAAKRDAGLIDVMTIDGFYRAMQGIRTHPATGSMTLHGETTGATYDKTVDYVGFVWGTTRHNNPEGTAPDASGYDQYWISPVGDYAESKFAHTPELLANTTYYYRAVAEVDGAWVYGEELTLTVAEPSSLPNLYPAKLGSPYTILTAPYTTGDVLMTVHDADKLETSPNIVCLSGSVAGEFSYTGRYGNTLTGVTALPGTPQATWGVGTFAFRGIAAYDLNALVETVERLKEQIAALQTPGE